MFIKSFDTIVPAIIGPQVHRFFIASPISAMVPKNKANPMYHNPPSITPPVVDFVVYLLKARSRSITLNVVIQNPMATFAIPTNKIRNATTRDKLQNNSALLSTRASTPFVERAPAYQRQ
jgi:hypothetical protein